MRRALHLLLFAALTASCGCQQRIAIELLGSWEGQPDTAAARRQREAERFGDTPDDVILSSSEQSPTDWEQYDAAVTFDFRSRTEITISLQNEPPIEGSWLIVQSGPSSSLIEVETATGAKGAAELRRYRLEFDRADGDFQGFLLSEVGADRGLGSLYFRRKAQ